MYKTMTYEYSILENYWVFSYIFAFKLQQHVLKTVSGTNYMTYCCIPNKTEKWHVTKSHNYREVQKIYLKRSGGLLFKMVQLLLHLPLMLSWMVFKHNTFYYRAYCIWSKQFHVYNITYFGTLELKEKNS